jgi:hypothetical protein
MTNPITPKIQFNCKLSGVQLALPVAGIKFKEPDFIHPALLSSSISRQLLELDISTLEPSDTVSLRLMYANLLQKSKLVDFNSPINSSNGLILNSYPFIKPILIWTNLLPARELSLLPRFSITPDSSDMESFNNGFCQELRNFKNVRFKQDLERRQMEVLDYLEQRAKKRMAFGKQGLNVESVKFIFTLAGIPETDFDFYLSYLNKDTMQLIGMANPVIALLDLEEYLEEFISQSLLKTLILKIVRDKLAMLKELGYSLPSEYYELDEETQEYKPKFKSSSSLSFSFSIPTVNNNFNTNSNRVRTSPKPIKASYSILSEYLEALTAWLKS